MKSPGVFIREFIYWVHKLDCSVIFFSRNLNATQTFLSFVLGVYYIQVANQLIYLSVTQMFTMLKY